MREYNTAEDAGTHYYAPVPVGESLAAWMDKHSMSREIVAYRLGLPVKRVDEILAGKGNLGDKVAFALGKMVGMKIYVSADEVRATVDHDNAPAKPPEPVQEGQP